MPDDPAMADRDRVSEVGSLCKEIARVRALLHRLEMIDALVAERGADSEDPASVARHMTHEEYDESVDAIDRLLDAMDATSVVCGWLRRPGVREAINALGGTPFALVDEADVVEIRDELHRVRRELRSPEQA